MNDLIISPENLHRFAYTNEECIKDGVKGIVVNFHGLGYNGMKNEPEGFDMQMGEHGILSIFPYYGPWNWMNRQAIAYVDKVLAAAKNRNGLAKDFPWVCVGGSMGGSSALVYSRYAEHTPAACAVNCPVCDLPFHATERDDLPRTMLASFSHYDEDIETAMKLHSPVHIWAEMPQIPYLIIHGAADTAVGKAAHSDKLVALMKNSHKIEYVEVPGMGHCDLHSVPGLYEKYVEFMILHCVNIPRKG